MNWLETAVSGVDTPWANRIKLTIDGSKVDGDLTDFPVLVHLGGSVGTNNQDTTAIFDHFENHTGKDFTGYQMVVNTGAEGTYDTTQATNPCVVISGSKYMMWYSGNDSSYWRIIYCDSTDGISWYNHQLSVNRGDEGTYDTNYSYRASVLLDDDGKYKMWYSGHNNSYIRGIYCDSTDGINWSNHQMVVDKGSEGTYDNNNVIGIKVIKDGSTYKMWYAGYTTGVGKYNIIYCDSTDGKNWSNFQRVIAPGDEGTYDTNHVFPSNVIKDGSTYIMWYSGSEATNRYRIIRCTSTDGKNWSNHQMVVDTNTEGTYDTDDVNDTWVIKDGSFYKVWYGGNDGSNNRTLYAYSQDDGGYDYRKKIAITTNSGTQQYVEIEDWSSVNQEAWLWTKVPTISSGINQYMYLYYDKDMPDNTSYVGDVGEAAGTAVWTNGFSSVWHLNQDPTGGSGAIKDSVASPNNGTTGGSMTSSDLVPAVIGNGIDFDGSNDKIEFSNDSSLSPGTSSFCVSAIVKLGADATVEHSVYTDYGSSTSNYVNLAIKFNQIRAYYRDGSSNSLEVVNQGPDLYDSGWHYLASIRNTQTTLTAWIDDGTYVYTDSNGSIGTINTSDGSVPTVGELSGYSGYGVAGIIDEVRVSKANRTNAWCKADYYSNWDDLVNFGAPQAAPTFGFTGYTKVEGVATSRHVGLYRRSTMALVDETYSNASTGYFVLYTPYNDYHFAVILPELTDGYNLLPYDKIHPEN